MSRHQFPPTPTPVETWRPVVSSTILWARSAQPSAFLELSGFGNPLPPPPQTNRWEAGTCSRLLRCSPLLCLSGAPVPTGLQRRGHTGALGDVAITSSSDLGDLTDVTVVDGNLLLTGAQVDNSVVVAALANLRDITGCLVVEGTSTLSNISSSTLRYEAANQRVMSKPSPSPLHTPAPHLCTRISPAPLVLPLLLQSRATHDPASPRPPPGLTGKRGRSIGCLKLRNNTGVATVDFPSVTIIGRDQTIPCRTTAAGVFSVDGAGDVEVDNNSLLVSLSLPALASVDG